MRSYLLLGFHITAMVIDTKLIFYQHSGFCTDLTTSGRSWDHQLNLNCCTSLKTHHRVKILWSPWTTLRSRHLSQPTLLLSSHQLNSSTMLWCLFLSTEATAEVLVQFLVISSLDYCNLSHSTLQHAPSEALALLVCTHNPIGYKKDMNQHSFPDLAPRPLNVECWLFEYLFTMYFFYFILFYFQTVPISSTGI